MLNWADLCSLMAVFFSTLAGAAAAQNQKSGWLVVILFSVAGFVLGYAFAFLGSKLAYAALSRSILPRGQRDTLVSVGCSLLYSVAPAAFMLAAVAATVILTVGTLSLFR